MKRYKIVFRPMAEDDLLNLYDYIAEQAGRKIAGDYIARIEAACLSLRHAPLRGTPRDDIKPGLRIVGFERRAAFHLRTMNCTRAGKIREGRGLGDPAVPRNP